MSQPVAHAGTVTPLQQAYVDFLLPYLWQRYSTYTFHSPVHPEQACKAYRMLISCMNKQIYGTNYHKRNIQCIVWIRALEYQKRGVIHYHTMEFGFPPPQQRNDISADAAWDVAGMGGNSGLADYTNKQRHISPKQQQDMWYDLTDSYAKCIHVGADPYSLYPAMRTREQETNLAHIIAYVSKYVVKGGEVDISSNMRPADWDRQLSLLD